MRKLPRVKHWDCNCIPCRLVRAGVCLDCAVAVHEQALEQQDGPSDEFQFQLHCGSCAEAFVHYLCGGKARQAKPQNSGRQAKTLH